MAEEASEDGSGLLPVTRLLVELFPACASESVELGFTIVVGEAPFRGNTAFLFELYKGGIKRAVIEGDEVSAGLFDTARDPIAVKRPERVQRFEDHQRESALQDVGFVVHEVASAMNSYGITIGD